MSTLIHEDLTDRERARLFVGREAERRAFRQNFEGETPEYLYFYIHGQGGIGKSFLVGHYQTIARQQGARTALTTEAEATPLREDSIVGAMERLSDDLCEDGRPLLPAFAARCARYRACMREVAADKNAPRGLADRVGPAAIKAGMGAAKETVIGAAVTAGGLVLAGSSEEDLAQRVGDAWSQYLARRFRRRKRDQALVLEPVETLTPLFVQDVNALAAQRPVVLCFDTWERTGDHLGEWLRGLPRRGLSTDVWLVIAGRRAPGDEWESFVSKMAVYELETFSQAEARDYLRRQGITQEARVRQILDFAVGVPVLVSTLASARGGTRQRRRTAWWSAT
jgi:hypothetical protein